ncbi:MAG: transaldolase [Anaerolineae bacterium]|nr:transaldolase [Anaerolineae bacterium]
MGLYLDSADVDDARTAQELGFIEGVTTNPALIARTGRAPLEVLADLVEIVDGNVFYQLTSPTLEQRLDEAWEAYGIRPDRVVLKVPTTTENLSLVAELAHDIECAMTAIFSPAQAYMAVQAGARYVIPYVSRATRLLGDGPGLVRAIRDVLSGSEVEIIAASIESPDEAIDAVRAGAHHLTMPLQVIMAMGEHELSQQTIAEFAASWETK